MDEGGEDEKHQSMIQVSALILARGCSKSIAGKNVKKFLAMPLVCHTVKTALQCNHFQSVWVSTDDESLGDLVSSQLATEHPRVHIHMRSRESASDTASSLDAVREFLTTKPEKTCHCQCQCCRERANVRGPAAPADPSEEGFGHSENVIAVTALIQCTSPILHFRHLQSVCQFMLANSSTIQSVFSACADGTSLKWHQVTTSKKYQPVNFDPYNRPRRQNMNPDSTFVESGHFYFFHNLLPLQQGLLQSLESGRQAVHLMHPGSCIELDYPYQWDIAEAMYRVAEKNEFYLHEQEASNSIRFLP